MAFSETTKALYEEFYAQFQSSRTALTACIGASKSTNHTKDVSQLTQDVARLRKSLVDGTSLLPAYDQRQCEAQMAALESLLEDLRSSAATKPKFAFKRKSQKPASEADESPLLAQAKTSPDPPFAQLTDNPSMFRTVSSHSRKYLDLVSLPPPPSSEAGPSQTDLTIADMRSCIVDLCSTSISANVDEPFSFIALHIRDITDSILILPPVRGSVLLQNITRSVIAVGCHQFRMHTSKEVQIYLSIPSNPIIEHCNEITFAPYPPFVFSKVLKLTEPPPVVNKHAAVQDFSHIRQTPSPNWSVLEGPEFDWEAVIRDAGVDVEGTLIKHLPWKAG